MHPIGTQLCTTLGNNMHLLGTNTDTLGNNMHL